MFAPLLRRLRRRLRLALYLALVLLITVNLLAFMHARAMTHFGPAGPRPPKPWEMSAGQKVRSLFLGVSVPRPSNWDTPARFDLPFDTQHFKASDGMDLEAWHIPCDNPRGLVVCFHGYMNSKSSEIREARVFRELGYETMLLDFRGGGGSAGNETTVGYREALDVTAAMKFANQTFHPPRLILYGQSMGSAAILRAIAMDHLAPDALILECPYDSLLNTVANRFTSMGLPSFPLARMLVFWGSVQEGYWAFSMNPAEYAAQVTCPTLYIRGGDDPWVTADEAKRLFDQLRGEKTLVTIPHSGHEGSYPRQPELWRSAVQNFLDGTVDKAAENLSTEAQRTE